MNHCQIWDEYQWEDEIRKHEHNIARFFLDLVYCLDLPIGGVSAELNGTTSGMPSDPVTARSAALRQWISDHEEDDGDGEESTPDYAPRHPVCFSCVDSLDHLASQWNQFAIAAFPPEMLPDVLGISCSFAKLLARTADFTEPAGQTARNLLITLGKRALNDLEDLADRLYCCKEATGKDQEIDYFLLRIALLRDQLAAKLAEQRNPVSE